MERKSAKKICSMLITRQLTQLSEDEEEIVIDYLEELGVETSIDDNPKQMCVALLRKVMEEEFGNSAIPISAYANKLLKDEQIGDEAKNIQKKREVFLKSRRVKTSQLSSNPRDLPGCVQDISQTINHKKLFHLVVDKDFDI